MKSTIDTQRDKDIISAKDPEKYETMVKVFANAESKKQMESASMMFVLDMAYSRADICLAMHTIELANKWR